MTPREPLRAHSEGTHPLVAGGVGGLLGGAAMGVVAAVLFPALGLGSAFRPFVLFGALLDQNWAQRGFSLGPFLVGLAIHVVMSLALGVLFAWLVNYSRGRTVVVDGLVFGLVVWLVNHLGLLRIADPAAARGWPWWLFAVAHALYGLIVGGFVAWTRAPRLTRAAERTSAAPAATRAATTRDAARVLGQAPG